MESYQTTVLATPAGGYKVNVTFSNGEHGVFDMTPYLNYPCYAPLKEPQVFARVVAAHGTLAWPEEIDISPEAVWADAVRV
jgi:hypothetical protein